MQAKKSDSTPSWRSHQKLDMGKWAKLVEAWNNQEESKKAFCKRLNLNINTFNYVRQKLAGKKLK